jgi:DUF1680 family protein
VTGKNRELRGHFVGGHYLSACAMAFASSGDEELKHNGDQMVAELAKCQAQHKNGQAATFVPLSSIVHERYAVYHEVKGTSSL